METIKEKIIVIIGIVLVIALCCGAYYMLVYQSSDYYTQIDNAKVEKISKHDMNEVQFDEMPESVQEQYSK